MRDDGRPPLESVDRALQLIEALRDGRTLTVKAAAEMLGVAPSTAHRLLNALRYREFARQVDDRGYRAGPALSGEDEAFTPEELTVAARPALELLHDRTDESSQLMIRRGTDIQFLDGVESTRPLRVAVRIGDRIPAHCSAGGKALLARLDGPAFDQLYAQGLPLWPTASITTTGDLRRHLQGVRRCGYGVNQDETEDAVSGIGVVVTDPSGHPVAALTLAVPSARFDRRQVTGYLDALGEAAALTGSRLGAAPAARPVR
ncbi:IclR family transcriptional regulator [Nocardioides sp. LMS-CY]|uniref:IclR family transcriptional regulator n=1 Tax=Nocardioides sp. (strain LMS-CY) TaxID=2840457 RepID=UPI001C003074|nr:IclR family transcriptional regulator [Nocardioides sp. LMS-CY]QWF22405.1 IclR family transcriptional regulator [Nocardioides sp. LMS-CY]